MFGTTKDFTADQFTPTRWKGAEEKARFMAEMWTLLRATLGPNLREETYVVCHEVATDAYGRGGLTRAERDHRRAAAG